MNKGVVLILLLKRVILLLLPFVLNRICNMLERDAEKTKGSAAAFLPREHQNKVMLLASSYAS